MRFLSAEPLIGPLQPLDLTGIHWVIVGGESGPGYRAMESAWARAIRDLCIANGIPFFYKQDAAPRPETRPELDGRLWHEFPGQPAVEQFALTDLRQSG